MIKLKYSLLILTSCTLLSCNNKPETSADTPGETLHQPSSIPSQTAVTKVAELPESQKVTPPSINESQISPEAIPEVTKKEPQDQPQPVTVASLSAKEVKITPPSPPKALIADDPRTQAVKQWKSFVINRFHEAGDKTSPAFEWYMEFLIKGIEQGLTDNNIELKNAFMNWRNPSPEDQDKIFSEVIKVHTEEPKEGRRKGFPAPVTNESGKTEIVYFLNSFEQPYDESPLSKTHFDRVAILRTPDLFHLITDKRNPEEMKTQAENLSNWVNYLTDTKIPVHIMGKCDYLCSAYVAPQAEEVSIEPLGEILLNGDLLTTRNAFINILRFIEKERADSMGTEKYNANFSQLLQERLMKPPVLGDLFNFLEESGTNSILPEKFKQLSIKNNSNGGDDFYSIPLPTIQDFTSSLSPRSLEIILRFIKERDLIRVEGEDLSSAPGLDEILKREERLVKAQNTILNVKEFYESYQSKVSTPEEERLNRISQIAGLLATSSIIKSMVPSYLPIASGDFVNYSYISLRHDYLNNVGINAISGNNSGLTKYSEKDEKILIVTEKTLANCHFEGAVVVAYNSLKECSDL